MNTTTVLLVLLGAVAVFGGLYFVTRPRTPAPTTSSGGGGDVAGTISAIGGSLTGLAASIAGAVEAAESGATT